MNPLDWSTGHQLVALMMLAIVLAALLEVFLRSLPGSKAKPCQPRLGGVSR